MAPLLLPPADRAAEYSRDATALARAVSFKAITERVGRRTFRVVALSLPTSVRSRNCMPSAISHTCLQAEGRPPFARWRQVRPWDLRGPAVALIVKQRAAAAGLDPSELSGHSLRAGFCTSAAETCASVMKIRETLRHKSIDVLAGYVRRAALFRTMSGRGSCGVHRQRRHRKPRQRAVDREVA
jgi:hypothetical protein